MGNFSHYEACPACQEKGLDTRGDNRGVYHNGGKYCFSCNRYWPPRFLSTPLTQEAANETMLLPPDFTREVPADAWRWLLQYGLGYKYWLPYVGWSEAHSRLVFQVGEPTEFSTGRYIESLGYKREGPPRKWFVWGNSHRTPHIFGDIEKATSIVLVEDIISAHKVSQVQPAIPLFGTAVFDSIIGCLKHLKLPIVMWLDHDQQGGAPARAARLSVYTGLPVTYIFSDKDPKLNTIEQIRNKVET